MKLSVLFPVAAVAAAFMAIAPAKADILDTKTVVDSYWMPKHRDATDKAGYVEKHVKSFLSVAGKDGRLDRHDLERQRNAGVERIQLRARLDFLYIDNDLDGTITFDEIQAFDYSGQGTATERMARYDLNKDGVVSEREWLEVKLVEAEANKGGPDYTQLEFDRYWSVDPNQDRSLTTEEYRTAVGSLYDQYDIDGDGKMSDEEMGAWRNVVLASEITKLLKQYPELKDSGLTPVPEAQEEFR